jgi:alkylation response protein AidB-like acyl-CoA dehydrogenase
MAMQYARTGRRGERSLSQSIQLKLSEMHMLTEALRSFVLRVAAETDTRGAHHSINNVLLMNFSTDVVQRVTRLNLEVHGAERDNTVNARADKLARDAIIWTHLAGDSVQRMKAIRRLNLA